MSPLNRCALTLRPRRPMLDWIRPFASVLEVQEICQHESLYLLPCFEDQAQAWQRLEQVSHRVFQAELELWCRDPACWPEDLSFSAFQRWFAVAFHPLVEDLGEEPLRHLTLDPAFSLRVRAALGQPTAEG